MYGVQSTLHNLYILALKLKKFYKVQEIQLIEIHISFHSIWCSVPNLRLVYKYKLFNSFTNKVTTMSNYSIIIRVLLEYRE